MDTAMEKCHSNILHHFVFDEIIIDVIWKDEIIVDVI
jgi:hypothetical protein